jgi:hypothetical protein
MKLMFTDKQLAITLYTNQAPFIAVSLILLTQAYVCTEVWQYSDSARHCPLHGMLNGYKHIPCLSLHVLLPLSLQPVSV